MSLGKSEMRSEIRYNNLFPPPLFSRSAVFSSPSVSFIHLFMVLVLFPVNKLVYFFFFVKNIIQTKPC